VVTMSILTAGSTENQLMIFSNIFPPQWIEEPFLEPAPPQEASPGGSQVFSDILSISSHMQNIIKRFIRNETGDMPTKDILRRRFCV
jgi:hypothetical protein